MPNTGRYTVCPFYLHDRTYSISCEDTPRRFELSSQKEEWMDRYCDLEWESCPYAAALLIAYDMIERGVESALEENRVEAQKKEMHKMSSMVGRLQKKLEEKEKEILELKHELHDQKERCSYLELKILTAFQSYEARFAYLMTVFSGGIMSEADFKAWSENKEFVIVGMDRDEEGTPTWWKAEVREVQDVSDNEADSE